MDSIQTDPKATTPPPSAAHLGQGQPARSVDVRFTAPSTWAISPDPVTVPLDCTITYTLTATAGWGYSKATFSVSGDSVVVNLDETPSFTLSGGFNCDVQLFSLTSLVILVANSNEGPSVTDVCLVLTVSDGSSSSDSPDPQIVLPPRDGNAQRPPPPGPPPPRP